MTIYKLLMYVLEQHLKLNDKKSSMEFVFSTPLSGLPTTLRGLFIWIYAYLLTMQQFWGKGTSLNPELDLSKGILFQYYI